MGGRWSHHATAGERAPGTAMATSLAPCPAAALVCASPPVGEQLEVLLRASADFIRQMQHATSSHPLRPPGLVSWLPASAGGCRGLAQPAEMISSTVSVMAKTQCQQPWATGWGQGTPVGSPWEHSPCLHSKHLTAPCSHRGDSPTDGTLPPDTAPPRDN